MTFTLTIELGNVGMIGPDDVARALRVLANDLEDGGLIGSGGVRDENGNTVGQWTVVGRDS